MHENVTSFTHHFCLFKSSYTIFQPFDFFIIMRTQWCDNSTVYKPGLYVCSCVGIIGWCRWSNGLLWIHPVCGLLTSQRNVEAKDLCMHHSVDTVAACTVSTVNPKLEYNDIDHDATDHECRCLTIVPNQRDTVDSNCQNDVSRGE